MFFRRSVPQRAFRDYADYRALLRQDFQYRCAYCLLHEYFLGGEAGCCIDHHRPLNGPFARPDLIADYNNLYWCCRECNENKGDAWPTSEDYASGFRFLDPCQPEDDHDLHWRVVPNGLLEPLTPTGRYTIRRLKLWRPFLQHHRARIYQLQEEVRTLERDLSVTRITEAQRALIERRLTDIRHDEVPSPHPDVRRFARQVCADFWYLHISSGWSLQCSTDLVTEDSMLIDHTCRSGRYEC